MVKAITYRGLQTEKKKRVHLKFFCQIKCILTSMQIYWKCEIMRRLVQVVQTQPRRYWSCNTIVTTEARKTGLNNAEDALLNSWKNTQSGIAVDVDEKLGRISTETKECSLHGGERFRMLTTFPRLLNNLVPRTERRKAARLSTLSSWESNRLGLILHLCLRWIHRVSMMAKQPFFKVFLWLVSKLLDPTVLVSLLLLLSRFLQEYLLLQSLKHKKKIRIKR